MTVTRSLLLAITRAKFAGACITQRSQQSVVQGEDVMVTGDGTDGSTRASNVTRAG